MADPCAIISTVASSAGQSTITQIKPHIDRALNAKRNLDDLKSQVEKLKIAKETVQGLVDEARDNRGSEIHQHVENWLTKKVVPWTSDDLFTEDDGNAKKRCFIGLCPNYITRYRISVKVEKGAKDVAELLEEAARYDAVDKISRRPPALATRVMSMRNYEAPESRTSIIKQIVDALASSGKNLIGLYGMGGVGKTTLLKVIAAQVLEEELFDKVVIGTITKNPNVEVIQEEIAESLGLKFEEKSGRVRASRLRDKLKQEQKILVILDDLWGRIDLEAIGIPFPDQQKGLKILMTSRDEHVLSRQMGAEETFQLQVLDPDEAWDLFQKMVGDVKDPSVRSIAKQVAERCAGLPVLLATVARALRGGDLNDWKDALNQLLRFKDNKFAEQVFAAMELSYKALGSDDTKSLFLLCGHLGPQRISPDYLLKYGRGLGLFESSSTLEDARIRLYKLVKDLKASCLLLDDNHEGYVRMNDVVHNFATLIASRDRPVFKVAGGSELRWPSDDTLRQCTVIHLDYCNIPDFPVTLDCPKLELLVLDNQNPSVQFPDDLFTRMKESLKVMDLTRFHFPRLPPSIQSLENLQTLCLDQCILEDIHIIGELTKLKVLSFWGSDIVMLPKEIGQLVHLESLDLGNCRRLAMIPPDVLSRLTKLEDLNMENVVLQWDVEEQSARKNASLAELKRLEKLATLNVHITDAKMLPKGLFFEKLERFRIFIGEGWDWSDEYETSRTLKLKLNTSTPLAEGLKLLLNKSEDLYLRGEEGVSDVLKVLEVQSSSQLKHLNVHNSLDVEFLANSTGMGQPHVVFSSLKTLFLYNLNNLKKICRGQTVAGSFGNLRVLKVGNCDKLKYLISLSMAGGLSLLEEIEVFSCKIMEKIVVEEGEDGADKDEQIKWNQLRSLTLQDLPQLESFCSELKGPSVQETNQVPSPTDRRSSDAHEDEAETTPQPPTKKACFPQFISFCSLSKTRNKEVATNSRTDDIVPGTPVPLTYRKAHIVFPNLEELTLSSLKMENLCDSRLVDLSFCSEKLTSLIVRGCDNLRSLFTHSMVKNLGQLRKLEICDCKLLEEVIVTNEKLRKGDVGGEMLFAQLDFLRVKGLQQLKRFCLSNLFNFSSLKTLCVESCPNLKTFVSSPTVAAADSALFDQKVGLPKLEELRIVNMDGLKKIWDDNLHEGSFAKLKTLKVEHAVQLENVFPSKLESVFQSLEIVLLPDCDSLTKLFDTSSIVVSEVRTLTIKRLPKLKFLFLASIARRHLHLEVLEVVECGGIEEIVTRDETVELKEVPVFRFPQLTYLVLWELPKLKGFYSGRHISEWPMLTRIAVSRHIKSAIFDWESWTQRSQEAGSDYGEVDAPSPRSLLPVNAVIPNLKELTLNAKDVAIICNAQVPPGLFRETKILRLILFHGESTGFLIAFLERYFSHLEILQLRDCSFEETFSQDVLIGEENRGTVFPQLRLLRLVLIHNLKQFWKQDSQPDHLLRYLENLEVWECHDLTHLAPLSSSFHSLTTLDVFKCNGMLDLFSSSMAKLLVQLAKISIRECAMVTEIVANKGDGAEEEIIFSNLETLELYFLPSLTSFCSENHSLKFPSLVGVVVRQCPKMRAFSRGDLSTPQLQNVQSTEDGYKFKGCWEGDLNATIQKLHKELGQAAEQSLQLDSETTQAEKHDKFAPIEDVAAEKNLELEAKAIPELKTKEQDVVPEITRLGSKHQVSDGPSNDRGQAFSQTTLSTSCKRPTSKSDASQENPTSAQSSSTPTNRESDIPVQFPEDDRSAPSSEPPQQEDVPPISIQQSKALLESSATAAEHGPMTLPKTTTEVLIEDRARKDTSKTPETAQYVPVDIVTSTVLNDKTEPRKHQDIASPVSAPTTAEQALTSISEHLSKPTSSQELTCSVDNSTSEASSVSLVKTLSHSPADFESLLVSIEKLLRSSPTTTFHSASCSDALPESNESSDHARPDSYSHSVEMLQNTLENTLAGVYDGFLSQSSLENLKKEIDRTVIEFSIEDDQKKIFELKSLYEDSKTEISTLEAEREAWLTKVQEIEEKKNRAQANMEELYHKLVERKEKLEKNMDALREAARQ